VLFHSFEEMFSLIFQLLSTLRSDLDGCVNRSVAPRNMMAKIRGMNFPLLTKSGWTQDQDRGSLSNLLALRSLAYGSPG
jgi:hypothetical protein